MHNSLRNYVDISLSSFYNEGEEGVIMAVTIKDVAKLAKVSCSTVSRTCRNHPSISEETKKRVREAMDTLGYERDSVIQQETHTIGVVFPMSPQNEIYANPFYLEAIRGIGQYCNHKRYTLTIITGADEHELIKSIRTAKADGFIFLYSNIEDTIMDYMYEENLLFVLIGKATRLINDTIYVDNDNVQAAREACEYLIKKGHQRIGYIGTDDNKVFSNDRKAGYLLALTSNNIPYRDDYCLSLTSNIEENCIKIQQLLCKEDRPSAILVCDDMYALLLEKEISVKGLRIPQDISLIGFNNSLFSRMTHPQLTCIDINAQQLGMEAASQLIKHIEHPNLYATKIIVPYQFVERESCMEFNK